MFYLIGLGVKNQFQFQNQTLKVRNLIIVVKLNVQFPVRASFFFKMVKSKLIINSRESFKNTDSSSYETSQS